MRKSFPLFVFVLSFFLKLNAQTTTRILAHDETQQLITDSCRKSFNINAPILRVYELKQTLRTTYWILTEHISKINQTDTFHDKLKAIELSIENGIWTKKQEVNDFTETNTISGITENNIWFWTRYCQFEDTDKDGTCDPILVYGTRGDNGFDDGRIKILIFYKGKKTAIRHQNGVLDSERSTKVDPSFYQLPPAIQTQVKTILKKITEVNHGIFPEGWEKAMTNKKTFIKETGK